MDHDQSYKLLFSHAEMVADLLRGFVREDWVQQLDFDSREKVNGSYVADDLREREGDVIWRGRWGREWLYVYLLIEFQSTVDRYMAVRILVYLGLLYQDLVRTGQLAGEGRLPPVLPIVLYNGNPRWSAPIDIADLIVPVPGGLETYRPRSRYFLLDEGRYAESELAPLRNLAATLFRLENSRTPQDVERILAALVTWLRAPEQSSLRRAFTVWLKRVFLPGRLPGVELGRINDLQEVQSMLAERVTEWTEEWKRQGRLEGEAALLLRQLEQRFGPLNEADRTRVSRADAETLLHWGERVLTAQAIEDVFDL
ncbi:Rpn family recombination-promoting nuclease/putative transposase [Methylocaldum sp.]|uniref:Rpn family recombination-promoting nuclease/putative transposase n=1 Tax=Methylocaldum sp. TaxID=1969727 RepID=UPI00321FA550